MQMKDILKQLMPKMLFFLKGENSLSGEKFSFVKINAFYLKDKSTRCLSKVFLFAVFFVVITGGIYGGLKAFLIPYYQSTQILNQQILSENELKRAPEQNQDQWQLFERVGPGFYFTNIKIKTALNSLCLLYNVNLKSSHIHNTITLNNFSFKPGNLTITAATDKQIFAFLQHLFNKLSGVLVIKVVKLHRNRDINEKLVVQIKSAQGRGDLIEAFIEFEWLIFKHNA